MRPARSLAALTLVAALALSGCAAGAEPEATPTPTESSFLDEMRSTEAFFGFSDEQLQTIGQSTCDALRDGSSFDDIVDTLAINDFTKDQATTIIFASAAEYCPEQAE